METPAIFTLDTLTMGKKGQEACRSQMFKKVETIFWTHKWCSAKHEKAMSVFIAEYVNLLKNKYKQQRTIRHLYMTRGKGPNHNLEECKQVPK